MYVCRWYSRFLNQACAGCKLVCDWFLEIDFFVTCVYTYICHDKINFYLQSISLCVCVSAPKAINN